MKRYFGSKAFELTWSIWLLASFALMFVAVPFDNEWWAGLLYLPFLLSALVICGGTVYVFGSALARWVWSKLKRPD